MNVGPFFALLMILIFLTSCKEDGGETIESIIVSELVITGEENVIFEPEVEFTYVILSESDGNESQIGFDIKGSGFLLPDLYLGLTEEGNSNGFEIGKTYTYSMDESSKLTLIANYLATNETYPNNRYSLDDVNASEVNQIEFISISDENITARFEVNPVSINGKKVKIVGMINAPGITTK